MLAHLLENHAQQMRERVFEHMLKTRSWKYRAFLRYLTLFKYASFNWTKGTFLESYYTLMRYLDDIVDGDTPIPEGYTDGAAYLQEKIRFSENLLNPVDEVDYLLLHCFILAERFGADFRPETQDILHSLLFDANRRDKQIIFPEQELMHHFHLLDVRGTIRATLKVFGEDPDKYMYLEPLGIACRFQFDLEDFEADIKTGYVNISREECLRFGISPDDLHNPLAPGIRKWLRHHAEQGLALLKEHHRRLPEGRFSWLARATFPLVYENPARRCFRKILAK